MKDKECKCSHCEHVNYLEEIGRGIDIETLNHLTSHCEQNIEAQRCGECGTKLEKTTSYTSASDKT